MPTKPASSSTLEHRGAPDSDSTGEPPRSAMPVIRGVAIVQVWSISGGATISPKRDRCRGLGIGVHRVRILERRRPVPDHRLVHRVRPGVRARSADRPADQRLQPVVERRLGHILGHDISLPRPNVARDARSRSSAMDYEQPADQLRVPDRGANAARITSAVFSAASAGSGSPHTTARMKSGPTSRS